MFCQMSGLNMERKRLRETENFFPVHSDHRLIRELSTMMMNASTHIPRSSKKCQRFTVCAKWCALKYFLCQKLRKVSETFNLD